MVQIARARGLRRGRDGVLGGWRLVNARGGVCDWVEDNGDDKDEEDVDGAGGGGSGRLMVRRGAWREDAVWRAVELPELWDEGDPALVLGEGRFASS
jgi:hypothetical protein